MPTSKVTAKGQVTVPQSTRRRLGLRPGDEVQFVEIEGQIILQKVPRPSPFAEYRGFLRHLAGRSTDEVVEEMRGR